MLCEADQPVGIVSERALVRALGQVLSHREMPTLRARDAMPSPVFSLRQRASLVDVNRRLEEICQTDALLEIGNRRAMTAALDQEHDRAERYRRPYAVVLFDVDHFKRFNDRYGHQAGDTVLREIARSIDGTRRSTDSLHRYGGEEILLVLPESAAQDALVVAERAVGNVAQLGLRHEDSEHGVVTLSAGVACAQRDGKPGGGWTLVVESADAALYRAKSEGRNRVAS